MPHGAPSESSPGSTACARIYRPAWRSGRGSPPRSGRLTSALTGMMARRAGSKRMRIARLRSTGLKLAQHADAARQFFASTIKEFDKVTGNFVRLASKTCQDHEFEEILKALLPEPAKPRNSDANPGLRRAWETNTARVLEARGVIRKLRQSVRGADLHGSRGTLWGVLNAVLEFVDHHQETKGSKLAYALL